MTDALLKLSDGELSDLCSALKSGRLSPPYSPISLERILPRSATVTVCEHLRQLDGSGLTAVMIAHSLDLVLSDRARRFIPEELLQLVITGPDAASAVRDTGVVVREVFANANKSVLVAGYAVYQGHRVFQALADRMVEIPELQVRMFLDVRRGPGDTSIDSDLLRRFREQFRKKDWPPGKRLVRPSSIRLAPMCRWRVNWRRKANWKPSSRTSGSVACFGNPVAANWMTGLTR